MQIVKAAGCDRAMSYAIRSFCRVHALEKPGTIQLHSRGSCQGSGESSSRKCVAERDGGVDHPNLQDLVDTAHCHSSLFWTAFVGTPPPKHDLVDTGIASFFRLAHATSAWPSKAR